ncbi:uncharacterized protein [Notamacropus eugenii]|uniref:uncharacterized protein isoform X2 n=1 Tax=Notamacropus eugenii TaxID=9315 RepID=UPI003B67FFBC
MGTLRLRVLFRCLFDSALSSAITGIGAEPGALRPSFGSARENSALLAWSGARHGPRARGLRDLSGRGCDLHSGGIGAPGRSPEGAVSGGDARKLRAPGLPGTYNFQDRCYLPVGERTRSLEVRGRCSPEQLCRDTALVCHSLLQLILQMRKLRQTG